MKRTLSALLAGVLVATAATSSAAEPSEPGDPGDGVDVMPGSVFVADTEISDDAVYAVSWETYGHVELFMRSRETDASGTHLGRSTRLGTLGATSIAEHDGTLAYTDGPGDLVLRAPDGTETRPPWGRLLYPLISGGPTALTADFVVAGSTLFDRETGREVALRDVDVVTADGSALTLPPTFDIVGAGEPAFSDTHIAWTVHGTDSATQLDQYTAVVVAELGPDGPVGPAVVLDEETWIADGRPYQPPVSLTLGGITGGTAVWTRTWRHEPAAPAELLWQHVDEVEPHRVLRETRYGMGEVVAVDGSVVTLHLAGLEQGSWNRLEWLDLSGDPTTPVRTAAAPNGYVADADGTLLAVQRWNGWVELFDFGGLALTGDPTFPVPVTRFHDVPVGHPFFGDVEWLVSRQLSGGYDDGGFHPTEPVSRQAMAAFLHRLVGQTYVDAGSRYTDVGPGHPFAMPIIWIGYEGIAQGYADGTFRPTAPVSRQAMAAFLYRFAGSPDVEVTGAPFPDVPADSEFARAITWMAGTGISGGYADGTFRPTAPVSRQAMATFLHRFDDAGLVPWEP